MGKNSFEKINYSLRPAKGVERKMLSFAFQKLNNFDLLSNYQYVGFGSTFFQDHILFHKDLGIENLISIEKSGKKERFNFNKPFHCINIKFGQSAHILPSVSWDKRTILWLDYDSVIRDYFLSDIRTFFNNSLSSSVFLCSLNVNPEYYGDSNKKRRDFIIDKLGEEKIPLNSKPIDFSPNSLHKTIQKIINNEIKSVLSIRNAVLEDNDKLTYKPIFNFKYSDNSPMLTVGGLLLNKNDYKLYEKANFNELSFISEENEIFEIVIPSLTMKEIRFLNSLLPSGINDGEFIDPKAITLDPKISKDDIRNYAKIYNYFPVFTESLVF